MSTDASHPPHLSEATAGRLMLSAASGPPHDKSDPLYEKVERFAQRIEHAFLQFLLFLRFMLFVLYLFIAVISFWLWMISAFFGVLRFALRFVMVPLLWASGGWAPRSGPPAANLNEAIERDLKYLWHQRLVAYEAIARPLARHLVRAKHATRNFWHWHTLHKASAVIFAAAFIGAPMSYFVPRPEYIQVTDDNATFYDPSTKTTTYLVHAVDMYDPDRTHEYENEDMWWLGKINSQGLKSKLQPGHYYKVWVVGIRWYFKPTLFPNLISAQEVDATGAALQHPSPVLQLPGPAAAKP